MSTAIEITALTKEYPALSPGTDGSRTTKAVDRVDLRIEAGELFFLLGPSGCGKTTLLRMIAGFIEPTAGSIVFVTGDGQRTDVTYAPAESRDTGMVFQSYALWPHMTVGQNVAFGLDIRRVSNSEKERRVREALATVQMDHLVDRKPTQLSGGQQQRVALARALVIQPRVLLLDEPLSNLDAKLRHELRSVIRKVCKSAGTTGIYVTHDQKEALSMADRIAIMKSGSLVQVGTPQDLYRRPTSVFAAEFMGETNLLAGHIESVIDGRAQFVSDGVAFASTSILPAGSRCTATIRPECIKIVPRGTRGSLPGLIVESTYLGEIAQLVIRSGMLQFSVIEPNPINTRLHEEIGIFIDPTDICLLSE